MKEVIDLRNRQSKQRVSVAPEPSLELQLIIIEAAETNEGLGCSDAQQCAKRICESDEYGHRIMAVMPPTLGAHHRNSYIATVIKWMIGNGDLISDTFGIYSITGTPTPAA